MNKDRQKTGLPFMINKLTLRFVEIHTESKNLNVSAFLLFQGHAELLGGVVGITISIEAKGTISRSESQHRTDCGAQVTFALDISIFLVINIHHSESWQEQRQIA